MPRGPIALALPFALTDNSTAGPPADVLIVDVVDECVDGCEIADGLHLLGNAMLTGFQLSFWSWFNK